MEEFSKRVIVWLVIAYFIVLAYAMAYYTYSLIQGEVTDISPLLDYTKMIMISGLLGYLLKAAFENKEKIKKSEKEHKE